MLLKFIRRVQLATLTPAGARGRWRARRLSLGTLALILLFGAILRFTGQDWDSGNMLHPDERFLMILISRMRFDLRIPNSNTEAVTNRSAECLRQYESTQNFASDCTILYFTEFRKQGRLHSIDEQIHNCLSKYPDRAGAGNFLDTACSAVNPYNAGSGYFAYGTLPLFIIRASSELVDRFTTPDRLQTDFATFQSIYLWYDEIVIIGRALSSLFDLLSIFFIFLIGRKVHSLRVGLLAAFFYASAPLAIQLAHFGTVNTFASFFVVFGLWWALRVEQRGHWRDYIGFGLAAAAAAASRINLLPLTAMIALAFVSHIWAHRRANQHYSEPHPFIKQQLSYLLLSAFAFIVAFRLFNPYAFAGPDLFSGLNDRWLSDLAGSLSLANGYIDFPPNRQWVGRLSYIYPLKDMLFWGMGVAFGIPAWLGLLHGIWRWVSGKCGSKNLFLLCAWGLGYFAWMGGNWVLVIRYFLPIYGALAVLAAAFLWHIHSRMRRKHGRVWRFARASLIGGGVMFSSLWAIMFHNIYREPMTRVQGSAWIQAHIPADISMRVEGAPAQTPLVNISLTNHIHPKSLGDQLLLDRSSRLKENQKVERFITAPANGWIGEILFPHVGRQSDGNQEIEMHFEFLDAAGNLLSQAVYQDSFLTTTHPLGVRHVVEWETPIMVESGANYQFRLNIRGGDLFIGGSIVTDEGDWDERLTVVESCLPIQANWKKRCEKSRPYDAQVLQYDLNIVAEDSVAKREYLLQGLERADYISISSNRFYDSQARNPTRFPLTNTFYHHLFQGELGFEEVARFVEGFEIGPFRILDQRFPNEASPTWLNELEADEAFHVYDHPGVWIFQKSPDYDTAHVRRLLEKISLTPLTEASPYLNCPHLNREHHLNFLCSQDVAPYIPLSSRSADRAPSQLLYSIPQAGIQKLESSWNEKFDFAHLLNRHQWLAVIFWWLLVGLLGLIAWIPLSFLFTAFSDRGYGLARICALLLVGWLAWLLSSIQLPVWNATALWLIVVIAGLFSVSLAWRFRGDFHNYLISHWRLLLTIEVVTLALFLFGLLLRLSNPDLWHSQFGGEKMMDSAYFNSVLRSEIFPPLNPWYSGAYINYYYFGFVYMGVPTLLSGIIPSISYNLVLATLISLIGGGAFSLTHQLANRLQLRRRLSILAGLTSMSFLILLGNLGTLHLWLSALYTLGKERLGEFAAGTLLNVFAGLVTWLGGTPLPINGSIWMWNPTRIIKDSINDAAITEFPFFSFLYGDLHAHLMGLPILILILGFALQELLRAEGERRNAWQFAGFIFIWGICSGLSWATNSWDWLPFTSISLLVITLRWCYNQQPLRLASQPEQHWSRKWRAVSFDRQSTIKIILILGAFLLINLLSTAPFRAWFDSSPTSATIELWQGPFTPIWAYLSIHGHFLLLLSVILLWQSRRLFANWRAETFLENPLLLGLTVAGLSIMLALAINGRSLVLLTIPLLLWTVLVFLRSPSTTIKIIMLLAGVALALTTIPEFLYLNEGIKRQNTIFKLYFMAWLLFSIGGGVAFALIIDLQRRWPRSMRYSLLTMLAAILLVTASYPILATPARANQRFRKDIPISLDGLEFLKYAHHWEMETEILYPLEPDYHIIRWLLENVKGAPVIIEGRSAFSGYHWNGRIASHTGLPSVLGWQWHQQQQRNFLTMSELIQQRSANITYFYSTENSSQAHDILKHYDVEYVILGPLEYALYDHKENPDPTHRVNGIEKFDQMIEQGLLEVVYEVPFTYETQDVVIREQAKILRVAEK